MHYGFPTIYFFSADDLNTLARAIYGEASGNAPFEERYAVASAAYNRLGEPGYSGGVQTTLTGVLFAPGQFRGVTAPGENGKFLRARDPRDFDADECRDLTNSVAAVERLISKGPGYDFTHFRGGTEGRGTVIGGSRFGYAGTFQ